MYKKTLVFLLFVIIAISSSFDQIKKATLSGTEQTGEGQVPECLSVFIRTTTYGCVRYFTFEVLIRGHV